MNNQNENQIDNVLFNEVPEAWIHGPVSLTLYARFKNYNWNEVPKMKKYNI